MNFTILSKYIEKAVVLCSHYVLLGQMRLSFLPFMGESRRRLRFGKKGKRESARGLSKEISSN